MSKINELIQQYCPDGVEFVPLSSISELVRGKVISKDYIKDNEGDYPVYSSQSADDGVMGRIDTYMYDGDYITWTTDGAYAGTIFRRSGKFNITNVCGLVKVISKEIILDFLYYWLYVEAPKYVYRGMGNPKLMSNVMGTISIPLPPLPVQEAIVNILDRFTVYAAELQAELQARQQQYNYYRDTLLSFEGRDDVQWKKLGELCPLITKQTGFDYSNYIKDKLVREKKENHIPYIQTKFFTGRQFDFNTDYYIPEETAARFPKIVLDTKCILLSIVGASIGNIGLYDNSQKSFLGGAIGVAKPSADVNTEFIYYYLTSHSGQKQIFHKVKGAGQATITIEDIREFLVPQPSLSEQQRIVDILDRFDTLVNDLSQGLPAEIEARQQQYEYYRDQLLTFKRKEA